MFTSRDATRLSPSHKLLVSSSLSLPSATISLGKLSSWDHFGALWWELGGKRITNSRQTLGADPGTDAH
jgi:hypothetical protein